MGQDEVQRQTIKTNILGVRDPGRDALRRAVLISLAALLLAVAGPLVRSADAATVTTKITVDGDVKKSTHDKNFTFSRRLSDGCHTVKVVQTSSGSRSEQVSRFCSDSRTKVVVDVDGFGDVDITVK
jgi:methionine-rich copper-binding protein CopC